MGCGTGIARFVLIGFNVFLGLIALACIIVASVALAQNEWINTAFAGAFVGISVLFFIYTVFGCRTAAMTSTNKHRCSSITYLVLSLIFFLGFLAISVILSVYLTYLSDITSTADNEFSVVRKTLDWDNSDVTTLYDNIHSSFDDTYDDGNCVGGGVANLGSNRGKTVISWTSFSCTSSGKFDAIDEFLRTPENGEESDNFLLCFTSIFGRAPTIGDLRGNQRLGTWCRSNKALFGQLETFVVGGATVSWILTATLLLSIASVFYLKCRT